MFRRDLNHAVPLLLRALFILSPVVYSADLLRVPCVLALRDQPRRGRHRGHEGHGATQLVADAPLLGAHLLAGVACLAACYWVFRRAEPAMGDYV